MPNEGHRGGAVRRQRPHQPAHDEQPPRRRREQVEPPSGACAARNPQRGEHATPARRAEGDRAEDEGPPDPGLEAGTHDQAEVERRRAVLCCAMLYLTVYLMSYLRSWYTSASPQRCYA